MQGLVDERRKLVRGFSRCSQTRFCDRCGSEYPKDENRWCWYVKAAGYAVGGFHHHGVCVLSLMWGVDNWLHWYASRMWNLCAPKRRHEVGLFACQLWNDRNGDLAIPSDSSPLLTALD